MFLIMKHNVSKKYICLTMQMQFQEFTPSPPTHNNFILQPLSPSYIDFWSSLSQLPPFPTPTPNIFRT